jgi:16S rRNA (guanine527-N7)-methyltransferase
VSDRAALDAELAAGLATLGLPLDAAVRGRLLDYVELLARWNATYNLTAVREPQAMVARHLLDSLAILPFVDADAVADLGTGPGLPGIPLALARPGLRVVLVEANGKKARFLREALRRLGLSSAEVVEARAEGTHPAVRLSRVVARALAALPDLVRLADPWLAEGGRLLAMKGPGHEDERRGLPAAWQVESTHGITVPGLDAGRFLVVLKRAGDP